MRRDFRNEGQTPGEILGTRKKAEDIVISRRDRRKQNLLKRRKQFVGAPAVLARNQQQLPVPVLGHAGSPGSYAQPSVPPRSPKSARMDSFLKVGLVGAGALRGHCTAIITAKTPDQILHSLRFVRFALATKDDNPPIQVNLFKRLPVFF